MTRLGYQIPNFTYPGVGTDQIIDAVIAQAVEAEQAGFDRVMVMDHFYQLPGIGAPDEPMFEAYTLLGALARETSTIGLSTLVTGNTYRNPALLAKEITTLDHVSGGRATLGIGAGWFELEHESLGFEFGTFADRFEKLDEALQIIGPMLRGERVSFDGQHYRVEDAINSPAPISNIPIMIGGSGEKKTLRMVAQYANESNLVGISDPSEIGRKLAALDAHCQRLGRDRSEITVTMLVHCNVAETTDEADRNLEAMAAAKGWPSQAVGMAKQMLVHGDPDTVSARIRAFVDAGLDGVILNLMPSGHIPGMVTLLADTARRALA